MTQQVHSFRASGVRSFQAARVTASKLSAVRKSGGVLCKGRGSLVLLWFIILSEIQTSKPRVLDRGLGKKVLALIPDEVLLV